jgi:hypothetical protein
MAKPLESANPHGIRVVADRAPVRADVQAAFAKGSERATKGIDRLIGVTQRRNGASASAKRSK